MKIKYTIAVAIVLAGLSSTASAYIYSENFDGMGTTGTTAPTGWSMLYLAGDSTDTVVPTSTEMAAATAGSTTLAVWNQTDATTDWQAQAANMGASATATDRLLGTSPTQSRGSILQLSLVNNTGGQLNSIGFLYDMQCMALGTLKLGYEGYSDELPGYSFYYLDGSTWTHLASMDLNNSTLNSIGHASAVINYSTPVANGGTMQFRWFDDNADPFAPDTMYAINNVHIVPEPSALCLLAVGALALISRRRKA